LRSLVDGVGWRLNRNAEAFEIERILKLLESGTYNLPIRWLRHLIHEGYVERRMDELEGPPRMATILIGEHRIVNALVIPRLRRHAREGLSKQVLGYCGKYL